MPESKKNADEEFRTVEWDIDRFQDGRRLDLILSERYPALSRTLWQERIRRGEVTIDHRSTRPSRIVRDGERIGFSYALRPEPAINSGYSVLFEDDSLLVINKPPNLPVHASGSYRKNTLNELLIRDFSSQGDRFICRPVHRLDRETSGIIVYAKTSRAASALTKSFLSGQVKKGYMVMVFGLFPTDRICAGRIGTDPLSPIRKKQRYTEDTPFPAKFVSCRTDFYPVASYQSRESAAQQISLLRAQLHTGRMHQIRATLFSLGFPVVGDRLYGPDETIYLRMMQDSETDEDRRRLILGRTALHCRTMAFPHPETRNEIVLTADMPPEMDPATAPAFAGWQLLELSPEPHQLYSSSVSSISSE